MDFCEQSILKGLVGLFFLIKIIVGFFNGFIQKHTPKTISILTTAADEIRRYQY
jgi:hypothetical protein